MPEHLRALAVLLVLAAAAFAIARRVAVPAGTAIADFARRRNAWFGVTLAAFLAHQFWLYMALAGLIVALAARAEPNPLALYYLLLFAVPAIGAKIGGLGFLEHLASVDFLRLLSLALLLPAWLRLRERPGTLRFGRLPADRWLLAYLALQFVLMLEATTATNALRVGVAYAFLDVFLPYYVASRGLAGLRGLREALVAFLAAGLVLSAIGLFEMTKGWLLYAGLNGALDAAWSFTSYLRRGEGLLRAQASTGQPIALGYALSLAAVFFLVLWRGLPRGPVLAAAALLLAAGVIAPLSRGPWLGAAFGVMLFALLARARRPSPLLLAGLGAGMAYAAAQGGALVASLPFVGQVDAYNIDYRERLLGIAFEEVMRRPVFGGAVDLQSAAFRELAQGDGFVDLVNTYAGIALGSGLAGLSLFLLVFFAAGRSAWEVLRRPASGDARRLAAGLLAALGCILVTIFTVSSITIIPFVYWSVLGIAAASGRLLAPGVEGAVPPGSRGVLP